MVTGFVAAYLGIYGGGIAATPIPVGAFAAMREGPLPRACVFSASLPWAEAESSPAARRHPSPSKVS